MVKFKRIFGNSYLDYDKTLVHVQEVVFAQTWTEVLGPRLASVLAEETPRQMAARLGINIHVARFRQDHAYLALRRMAEDGLISPVEG